MGCKLTDNCHGPVVNARLRCADGHAVRETARVMINDVRQAVNGAAVRITRGADKGDDAREFVEPYKQMRIAPRVA